MPDAADIATGRRRGAPEGPAGVARACRGAGFGVWVIGVSGGIGYLMALHAVPLPPAAQTATGPALASTRTARPAWRAIHVLAEGCPCSSAVADALVARGPAVGVDEVVYVSGGAGDDLQHRLGARGFAVTRVTPAVLLSGLAVRGGPWLVLVGPDGHVAYSGGYAPDRPRPGVALQDLSILRRLRAGERVPPLPAFGCAIDPALRRAMDPLGLK